MESSLLVVRLHSTKLPAGPGRVIAHVKGVEEFLTMRQDQWGEGSHTDLRLWRGTAPIGEMVWLGSNPAVKAP